MTSEPNTYELVEELRGTYCQCGKRKQACQTFCRGCYYRLPRGLQRRLYDRIGEGYEEAYAEARRHLTPENAS